jgi:hypothetical protein
VDTIVFSILLCQIRCFLIEVQSSIELTDVFALLGQLKNVLDLVFKFSLLAFLTDCTKLIRVFNASIVISKLSMALDQRLKDSVLVDPVIKELTKLSGLF